MFYGCANQAGEDNRNVARMATLLAGLPRATPAATINRLCASGLDAVGAAARAIRAGEIDLAIAGGVESMTRAPFVMGKSEAAFQRTPEIHDTTIGWRFVNPVMKAQYGDRFDAGDGRERGRRVPGHARTTRTPSRCARRSAPKARRGRLLRRARSCRSRSRRARARCKSSKDEHPRADTHGRGLAKLSPSCARTAR